MICVSLVLIRNVDKCMAWILPLLSDKDANMKVQIFVLRKDTADILGNTKIAIILPTGQRYAPSAVINDAWYCMVLPGIALYCMVLQGIA